jgi:hypothetical protein
LDHDLDLQTQISLAVVVDFQCQILITLSNQTKKMMMKTMTDMMSMIENIEVSNVETEINVEVTMEISHRTTILMNTMTTVSMNIQRIMRIGVQLVPVSLTLDVSVTRIMGIADETLIGGAVRQVQMDMVEGVQGAVKVQQDSAGIHTEEVVHGSADVVGAGQEIEDGVDLLVEVQVVTALDGVGHQRDETDVEVHLHLVREGNR